MTGKESHPKDGLVKLILSQQYYGRCNRVSIGILSLIGASLGVRTMMSYKTLERGYQDPDVAGLLNEILFITQLPVIDREHDFALDGTCHPTTIKQNWESSKDEILRLSRKRSNSVERKKLESEKTILAVGTMFKIIASLARTNSPFASESPCLRPLLKQVVGLYAVVAKVCADSGLLSRDNCTFIGRVGALPRIFPRKGRGSRSMLGALKPGGGCCWSSSRTPRRG